MIEHKTECTTSRPHSALAAAVLIPRRYDPLAAVGRVRTPARPFVLIRPLPRLKYNNTQSGAGRGWVGRNGTDAGGDSNEGQGRGTGGREEEGDGWAGVLNGGREQGEAGDGMAGGAERGT